MFEEGFGEVEAQHVGAVALGMGGVGVRLHEDAVGAHGDGGAGDGLYHVGAAAGDACRLVGLLQRVGDVDDDGHAVALHGGHTAEVDHEVLIAEGGAALGEHEVAAAEGAHLAGHLLHGLGREELALLDVDAASCLGGGPEELRLAAEEGGYLQHVGIVGGEAGLLVGVYVGNHGHAVALPHLAQQAQGLEVADAREGGDGRAVGLAVAGLEEERYAQAFGDGLKLLAHHEGVLVVLNNTRTGNQEEIAGLCVVNVLYLWVH